MAYKKARERLQEAGLGQTLSADDFEQTAQQVAIAALKFAELGNHRTTSYVFDLDKFMSFEGKTGPYLLYQAVRIKSLLRRAKTAGHKASVIVITEPNERELALILDAYTAAIESAYSRRAPNVLADHAFKLAQSFSRFYSACPVIGAEQAEVRSSRLGIAEVTLAQLENCLDLLGISVPEQM